MTGLLYGLGKLCVRRRWVVLGVWVLIFVALFGWSRAIGTDVNDNLTLPGTDSQAATDLLSERFPSQANGINPVVLTAPGGEKITASKFKTPIDDTVKALKADPDVRSATNPLSSDGKANVSKKENIGYIALNLKPSPSQLSVDDAERIVALADPAQKAGLTVGFGGYLGQKVSKPETEISEVDRPRDGGASSCSSPSGRSWRWGCRSSPRCSGSSAACRSSRCSATSRRSRPSGRPWRR